MGPREDRQQWAGIGATGKGRQPWAAKGAGEGRQSQVEHGVSGEGRPMLYKGEQGKLGGHRLDEGMQEKVAATEWTRGSRGSHVAMG